MRFSYDEVGHLALDSTCFATGNHIPFLVCVLNSKMGHYLLQNAPKTGTGDLLISVQAIEPLQIPQPASSEEEALVSLLSNTTEIDEQKIDNIIFTMYGLNDCEIDFINKIID